MQTQRICEGYKKQRKKHALEDSHKFNFEAAEVVDRHDKSPKRKILEALHIKKNPDNTNIKQDAISISSALTSFINLIQ